MAHALPQIVTLAAEAADGSYENHVVATTNDHVVRISTMTAPYHWHLHPDSDETFLAVEGVLRIEFADGPVDLHPGQMVTVPRNIAHRTLPLGDRSVNITVEKADARSVRVEAP